MSFFNRNIAPKDPCQMASDIIGETGYRLIDIEMIGQDPSMYCVEYVVVGRRPGDCGYATWLMLDWTMHPQRQPRDATLAYGHYDLTAREAESDFQDRIAGERRVGAWVYPGTERRIRY